MLLGVGQRKLVSMAPRRLVAIRACSNVIGHHAMAPSSKIRRLSSTAPGVVGVVGAGNMGRGIAASLARSGFGVAQYDITADLLASSAAQHEAIQAASASWGI